MSHARWGFLVLLFLQAGPAHASHPMVPPGAPYSVELVGENDLPLPTYLHRGRTYLLGEVGARYRIRVHNPTDRRVEAVISVDGIDAIDGRPADYARKRGYIVPPYGTVTIDGFRVSMRDVATFRFSSVGDSYAGRTGRARNVGVVGVALFAEREVPRVYMAPPMGTTREDARDSGGARGPKSRSEASPAPSGGDSSLSGGSGGSAGSASESASKSSGAPCCGERPRERPGLGTEFGERRSAPVSTTSFVRANPTRPTSIAELRYNDRDGLVALGIRLEPWVSDDEVYLRETAEPFPRSGYATPPPGWNR
jgi:hypothetical protein